MQDEVTKKLEALVAEDIEVGREMTKVKQGLDVRLQYHAQLKREATEPFEKELEPLKERRKALRREIFDLWEKHRAGEKTLKLPSAIVSRRNFREIIIRDKEALIDALDRADRLDLVDYVFKENEILRLVRDGKLPGLTEGAVKIIDNLKLMVKKKKPAEEPGDVRIIVDDDEKEDENA